MKWAASGGPMKREERQRQWFASEWCNKSFPAVKLKEAAGQGSLWMCLVELSCAMHYVGWKEIYLKVGNYNWTRRGRGNPSSTVFILQWAHCFSTLESFFLQRINGLVLPNWYVLVCKASPCLCIHPRALCAIRHSEWAHNNSSLFIFQLVAMVRGKLSCFTTGISIMEDIHVPNNTVIRWFYCSIVLHFFQEVKSH